MIEFLLFMGSVVIVGLFLSILGLGYALRRAFVRIERLEREQSGFRLQAEDPAPAILPARLPFFRLKAEATQSLSRSRLIPRQKKPRKSQSPNRSRRRIGAQWLLYIGVTAIVIGVAYFEKLAIDNNWLGETAQGDPGSGPRPRADVCRPALRARRLRASTGR